jgi:hypothetical protein
MPKHEYLNYAGVFLAALSSIFIVFIKSETSNPVSTNQTKSAMIIELKWIGASKNAETETTENGPEQSFFDGLSLGRKRSLGIFLACCASLLYGECFTPTIYMSERMGHRAYIILHFLVLHRRAGLVHMLLSTLLHLQKEPTGHTWRSGVAGLRERSFMGGGQCV